MSIADQIRAAQDVALNTTVENHINDRIVAGLQQQTLPLTPAPPVAEPRRIPAIPIKQHIPGGTLYSTMHQPDVDRFPALYLTAFHAFDANVRGALEAQYGQCFTIVRSEEDTRGFLDPTPDVHFFATSMDIVEAYKRGCPDPDLVSRTMGFDSPTSARLDGGGPPTVRTYSYPAGYDDGPPQKRLLSPFYVNNQGSTSGLHTFYSYHNERPDDPASVVGGNSGGGCARIGGPERLSVGVLVRAGSDDARREFAVVQPLHSQMEVIQT